MPGLATASSKTIDTLKVELILQPLPKAVVVLVPTWSMLPPMGMHCVLEYLHWFNLLLAHCSLAPEVCPLIPRGFIETAGKRDRVRRLPTFELQTNRVRAGSSFSSPFENGL